MINGDKRGSLGDIMFIVVVALFFSMILLIGYKLADEFNTKIQASDVFETNGKTASAKLTGYYPTVLDNGFLFLMIGLCVVAFIMAALVRIHPIFIPLYILAMLFVVILAGVFSNVYQEMSANSELSSISSNLVLVNFVMTYLPIITGVIATLLMIIMYKTWSIEQ